MDRKFPAVAGLIIGAILAWYGAGYYPGFYLYPIAATLFAIAAVYIFVKLFLGEIVFKHIHDDKTRYTANRAGSVIALIIIFIALVRIWVSDTSSLALSLGVLGAGIAIALQDVFKNFIGGFIIIGARLYEIGDRIEVGGEEGDVIDIGMMNTTLLELGGWVHGDQPTGRVTLVPNGKVITQQVHNYTRDHSFIWEELTIPITYDSDWKQAKEIMFGIVKQETLQVTQEAEKEIGRLGEKYYLPLKVVEPSIYLTPTDNWITFHVRYVVHVKDRRPFRSKLYELIIDRLQQVKDITIASGTLTVTLTGREGDQVRSGSPGK